MIERFHSTLKALVTPHVQHRHADWEEFLQELVYVYNTSKHSITGFTPYFLLYGSMHRPISDIDTIPFPEQEERIPVTEARDTIGDVVGIRNFAKPRQDESSKFLTQYKGPYMIFKRLSDTLYLVKDTQSSIVRTVHIKDMKSWKLAPTYNEKNQPELASTTLPTTMERDDFHLLPSSEKIEDQLCRRRSLRKKKQTNPNWPLPRNLV